MEDPVQHDEVPVTGRPTSLAVAIAMCGLEGIVIVVLAVLEVAHFTPARATMGATTALFFAAYGVGLVLCAVGLARLSSWARGPVVMAQLIQLGLAWNFRGGSTTAVSVLLTVASVITLVAVMSRPSRIALEAG